MLMLLVIITKCPINCRTLVENNLDVIKLNSRQTYEGYFYLKLQLC